MADFSFGFIFKFEACLIEKSSESAVLNKVCHIIDSVSNQLLGTCEIIPEAPFARKFDRLNMAPKRIADSFPASVHGGKKTKTAKLPCSNSEVYPTNKKDISAVFKDLNLVPNLPNDLQCAVCPYKATQKSNLKTHYKLKHLGGADLTVLCRLCQKKCTTKGNLKSHLLRAHNLSKEDAASFLS